MEERNEGRLFNVPMRGTWEESVEMRRGTSPGSVLEAESPADGLMRLEGRGGVGPSREVVSLAAEQMRMLPLE